MELVILSVVAAVMVVFSYLAARCEDLRKLNKTHMGQVLRPRGWKWILFYAAVPLSLAAVLVMLHGFYGMEAVPAVKRLILVGVLWPVAVFDFREYRVPNKLVLTALIFRLAVLIPEAILHGRATVDTVKTELIAAAGAAVLCLVCMLISRGSMGMGDLKLMVVMGCFLGIEGLCYAMFMSVFAAFIISIILLIARKKSRKDAIPFAPFILAGTIMSLILSGT